MAGRPKKPARRPLPAGMEPYKFQKGKSGNILGRPKRKPFGDIILGLADTLAPKEVFINGLEPLKGKRLTMAQVITARLYWSAATGTKNPGLPSTLEIVNRTDGKVPLSVLSREIDQDEFVGITEEELDAKIINMMTKLKMLGDGSDKDDKGEAIQ